MYDCTHCFACVEVCPKDVAPMNQIMRLRRRATGDHGIKDANNGYGHEKAFVDIIERWGTLHEAQLLPRSFGDGSLVKGQLAPSGAKQMLENLPTAVRGLQSGKVTPRKAAAAPQAARPGQGQEDLQGDRDRRRAARAQPVHRGREQRGGGGRHGRGEPGG